MKCVQKSGYHIKSLRDARWCKRLIKFKIPLIHSKACLSLQICVSFASSMVTLSGGISQIGLTFSHMALAGLSGGIIKSLCQKAF